MKCLSELPLCKRVSHILGSQVQADYKLSLSLYADENAETPECTQVCSGSAKHALATVLAFVGVIATACALMRGVCCLISKLCRS